ncbi:hypothetical protein CPT_Mater31 [Bacillus phage Mater]|uniref:Uncharacterized protein n=1 Tax=Bacillus phage Mater TaxID=1540090 RepID=A0A0A0RUF6_9CAUD|nr:hypothetical protein CPT_Mater31 [Bacillus phage Mater]AIW03188.1 hypothetical protein CPT_Mater31 [Bacillus phage Mater]
MPTMYNTVNEAIYVLNNIMDLYINRACMFHVGLEIVDDIEDDTPFNTADWGVYEDQEKQTVHIYNEHSNEVAVIRSCGTDKNVIKDFIIWGSTIQDMIGL